MRERNRKEGPPAAAVNVCEIFASVQGESTFAGLPCVFVRLSGCNLRCRYCDTVYAYDGGKEMTGDDVLAAVRTFGIGLVEVTGGEPLLQQGTIPLVTRLLDEGFDVLVETNGSVSIEPLDERAAVIMDIKCPSSGMNVHMDLSNIEHLKPRDEVKLVLSSREDYEWGKGFVRQHCLDKKCTVLFSPVHETLSAADLAGWIVADRLPVRLNLQLHKHIFGPDARGV